MKNLSLLPEDLRVIVVNTVWNCGCGQQGLRLSVTRKGSVQGHCFICGETFFCNDPQIFAFENPWALLDKEKPIVKKMANGGTTYWYPKSRIRRFTRG
jgi:hypothetical protein